MRRVSIIVSDDEEDVKQFAPSKAVLVNSEASSSV
jgi:hypothetical protein